MRIARVIGKVVLDARVSNLVSGSLLLCEPLDAAGLANWRDAASTPRVVKEEESLVMVDVLGAQPGDLVSFSESGEACAPFKPLDVPINAVTTAILDHISLASA